MERMFKNFRIWYASKYGRALFTDLESPFPYLNALFSKEDIKETLTIKTIKYQIFLLKTSTTKAICLTY